MLGVDFIVSGSWQLLCLLFCPAWLMSLILSCFKNRVYWYRVFFAGNVKGHEIELDAAGALSLLCDWFHKYDRLPGNVETRENLSTYRRFICHWCVYQHGKLWDLSKVSSWGLSISVAVMWVGLQRTPNEADIMHVVLGTVVMTLLRWLHCFCIFNTLSYLGTGNVFKLQIQPPRFSLKCKLSLLAV